MLELGLVVCAAETVDDSRVGSSRTSDTRSTFLDRSNLRFRLSSTAFSVLLLYFVAKSDAADSSSGIPSCSSLVCDPRDGRIEVKFERWEEDAITAFCDRLESACRLRRCV